MEQDASELVKILVVFILVSNHNSEMKRQSINLLSRIASKMLSNLAYKTLTNPQIKKLREHELAFLAKADKEKIKFKDFDIQTYKWGNQNDEKILLIHGWEGQAGNFTDIIPRLLENGYYVIAFDAPSHGFSSKGETSLFEFSDLVGKMLTDYQCKKILSHSFGGVATTNALYNNQDIEIDKYVLLTTPDKFIQRIDDVVKYLGITEKVKNILVNRLEKEMNIDVRQVSVSDFVKEINVNQSLIIHDKNDKVVPISQSINVHKNWKNSQLKEIEGTGHFRILRTKEVVDNIVEFMN